MSILSVPLSPTSSPVPESGTTVTFSSGTPRVIVPVCCSTKLPALPSSVPVTCSIATYPARPLPTSHRREKLACTGRSQLPLKHLAHGHPAQPGSRRNLAQLFRL